MKKENLKKLYGPLEFLSQGGHKHFFVLFFFCGTLSNTILSLLSSGKNISGKKTSEANGRDIPSLGLEMKQERVLGVMEDLLSGTKVSPSIQERCFKVPRLFRGKNRFFKKIKNFPSFCFQVS